MRLIETGQPFAEAGQAVPAPLHGIEGQVAVIVQSIALAYRFLEVFGAVNLSVVETTNFKAKAVGPEVYGGEAGSVLHD